MYGWNFDPTAADIDLPMFFEPVYERPVDPDPAGTQSFIIKQERFEEFLLKKGFTQEMVNLLQCPLSSEFFTDPVTLSSGWTVQRSEAQKIFPERPKRMKINGDWVTGYFCPFTRDKLNKNEYIPNLAIKDIVADLNISFELFEKSEAKIQSSNKTLNLEEKEKLKLEANNLLKQSDKHFNDTKKSLLTKPYTGFPKILANGSSVYPRQLQNGTTIEYGHGFLNRVVKEFLEFVHKLFAPSPAPAAAPQAPVQVPCQESKSATVYGPMFKTNQKPTPGVPSVAPQAQIAYKIS